MILGAARVARGHRAPRHDAATGYFRWVRVGAGSPGARASGPFVKGGREKGWSAAPAVPQPRPPRPFGPGRGAPAAALLSLGLGGLCSPPEDACALALGPLSLPPPRPRGAHSHSSPPRSHLLPIPQLLKSLQSRLRPLFNETAAQRLLAPPVALSTVSAHGPGETALPASSSGQVKNMGTQGHELIHGISPGEGSIQILTR